MLTDAPKHRVLDGVSAALCNGRNWNEGRGRSPLNAVQRLYHFVVPAHDAEGGVGGCFEQSPACIVKRAEQLFPGTGGSSQAQFWTGLRPATPSNVPIVGRCKLHDLFLKGHGTLGWTHACGAGKNIVPIVSGMKPEVDFAFASD